MIKRRKSMGGIKPLRSNVPDLRDRRKDIFLAEYKLTGIVGTSADKAGVDAHTIARWRHDDPAFDNACLQAYDHSTDRLVNSAFSRAVKHSDTLAMFLIKKRDPSYRDNHDVNFNASFGVQVLIQPAPKRKLLNGTADTGPADHQAQNGNGV